MHCPVSALGDRRWILVALLAEPTGGVTSKLEPLHGLVRSDRRVPLSRLNCSRAIGIKLPG